jgi:molybdopterin-containing oxidoreductase family iron-sulfur binding subunit
LPVHLKPLSELESEGLVSRRRFLGLMGASLALAGAGACTPKPLEKIVPYVRQPENWVPGKPRYYASAFLLGGYATGVLVESHLGRPTKIEGNPDHPASLGATDAFAQASILGLYDPDRSQVITELGQIRTWQAFLAQIAEVGRAARALGGAGLRILTGTVTSPTLSRQLAELLRAMPAARWHVDEPGGREALLLGAEQAFGEALDPDKLERLGRYEVHLDRKLERMLAMLLRLKDLRQGTIAG